MNKSSVIVRNYAITLKIKTSITQRSGIFCSLLDVLAVLLSLACLKSLKRLKNSTTQKQARIKGSFSKRWTRHHYILIKTSRGGMRHFRNEKKKIYGETHLTVARGTVIGGCKIELDSDFLFASMAWQQSFCAWFSVFLIYTCGAIASANVTT